jgi:hypothetical protein
MLLNGSSLVNEFAVFVFFVFCFLFFVAASHDGNFSAQFKFVVDFATSGHGVDHHDATLDLRKIKAGLGLGANAIARCLTGLTHLTVLAL